MGKLLVLLLLLALPGLADDKRQIAIRHLERVRDIATMQMCVADVGKLSTAVTRYAVDHDHKLPDSLAELVPQYMQKLPEAGGKPFVYKKTDATHYLISTPGNAFQQFGVPTGYPRYEGVFDGQPRGSKPRPHYWKPGGLVPEPTNGNGEQLSFQATLEMGQAVRSGDYTKTLGLYQQALQAGGLYPWNEVEIRRFLKEMGEK